MLALRAAEILHEDSFISSLQEAICLELSRKHVLVALSVSLVEHCSVAVRLTGVDGQWKSVPVFEPLRNSL